MSFKRSIVSLGFLAIALAAPAARAQTCKVNADCSKGFFCELVPTSAPAGGPVSTPPACPSGTVCPVADPTPTFVAPNPAPELTGYCQEDTCHTDADCGAGMFCHAQTTASCTGPAVACAPNSKCPEPTCTDIPISVCRYKWELPCNVDNDCGAGFTCKPTVSGWCSGSGGTPAAGSGTSGGATTTSAGATAPSGGGADVAPVPPDTMCGMSSTFPGYCEPKVPTCAVDTDCPSAWKCADAATTRTTNSPGVATSGPTSPGTGGAAGSSDVAVPSTDAGLPTQPPTTTPKMCASPLVFIAQDVGGTTSNGTGTSGPGSVPPKAGNPGATGTPMTPESAQPAAGCAVGGSSSGSPFAALLLGALGLLIARRKR